MGALDKFRIRGVVKSKFNPGRNANWDWNDLLTTIENNFESDFDLAALEASVAANTSKGNTNATNIATNATAIDANATAIATKAASADLDTVATAADTANSRAADALAKIAAICECLAAAEIACEACTG